MNNSEIFISETITSVLNQTYKNWELLLVDDASTDKTNEIAESFTARYSNIILFKNEVNSGAAITRNHGTQKAKGAFIAFLDADDVWKPEKLEKQVEFMKNHDCEVCFSSYEQIDQEGKRLNKLVKAIPKLTYKKLLKSNYIGNLTGIYSAKAMGKIMAPNLRKRQDWLLWLAAVKKSGKPALGIYEPLAYYRVRKESMSSNKFNLLKHNYWVYKKGLGFSTLKSMYCMLVFLKEHFFVKSKQIVSTNKI